MTCPCGMPLRPRLWDEDTHTPTCLNGHSFYVKEPLVKKDVERPSLRERTLIDRYAQERRVKEEKIRRARIFLKEFRSWDVPLANIARWIFPENIQRIYTMQKGYLTAQEEERVSDAIWQWQTKEMTRERLLREYGPKFHLY